MADSVNESDQILVESLKWLGRVKSFIWLGHEWRGHVMKTRGDKVPLDAFNRLLAKRLEGDASLLDEFNRRSGRNMKREEFTKRTHLDIQPSQIRSRKMEWTAEQLAEVATTDEKYDDEIPVVAPPIIVVEYLATRQLLDGNHRINGWLYQKDQNLHAVHIHTIEVVGSLVKA